MIICLSFAFYPFYAAFEPVIVLKIESLMLIASLFCVENDGSTNSTFLLPLAVSMKPKFVIPCFILSAIVTFLTGDEGESL